MSWAKFRTEYKKGFFAEEDMATVMSDAYDECVKTGMGGVLMLPALGNKDGLKTILTCLLYTSPSPRDQRGSRMPSSA